MAIRILPAGRASVTRRATLAVSALASAMTGAAAAQPSPDAKLLQLCQLCAKALATAQQYRRFHIRSLADEERHQGTLDWLDGRAGTLQARVEKLPATTLAGLHAKAHLARLVSDPGDDGTGAIEVGLAASLCRDLLALPTAS